LKVLFLHSGSWEYLSASIFHGLRSLHGVEVVDSTRYEAAYLDMEPAVRGGIRGKAFTLYGLLPDSLVIREKRMRWEEDLPEYDVVIFASPDVNSRFMKKVMRLACKASFGMLDGMDSIAGYPWSSIGNNLRNDPFVIFRQNRKVKYFKRELHSDGSYYGLRTRMPSGLLTCIKPPVNVLPISFSIPAEKITRVQLKDKVKQFCRQVVDSELANLLPGSNLQAMNTTNYYFDTEEAYYRDLQQSKFGITTKRGGWDCLRHYEMAANGAVLCFKDLDTKYQSCAPHGLHKANCIIYHSPPDLLKVLSNISESHYEALLKQNYDWINEQTTEKRAGYLLDRILNVP
jgi:hypothetical protein